MNDADLHLPALEFFSGASAWTSHTPFAMSLVKAMRPEVFVELGTYRGDSYLAFCQAVADNGLITRCFAVDTWKGDKHTGGYEEDVYAVLQAHHARRYGHFSTLMRMDFAAAAQQFSPGTIDLLHIDGLHTYEAVRNDFQTWLPKMSPRGVVLLHDVCVRHRDFGVFRFWDEIASCYPSFHFPHGSGLGVLCVGARPLPALLQFCQDHERLATRQALFARLGELLEIEARCRRSACARPADQRVRKNFWNRVRSKFHRGVANLRRAA